MSDTLTPTPASDGQPLEVTSEPLGPGRLVLVVGPSGAGKDTLLNGVRAAIGTRDTCVFARRMITRETDGETEDHICLSQEEFSQLKTTGAVGLLWEAHGLGYVIPQAYDDRIRAGHMVIANGSRRALPQALAKYQSVTVLLITAPVDVLATRLAARGRETREEIKRRLARANLEVSGIDNVIRIENTGSVEEGVMKVLAALDL
ncbi:phosphonate metabolism protein/1,5-bisphosphokinase (PRPP-forming) PhnN [Roseibium sp.]|uniref:phosphonate metabolism protein/1,5-bisphosphokinase (PRPP-forming) PhnN n=1 Tax=Roseibium sp. TaxID=1936156 RepID=UPI003A982FA4